MPLEDLKEFDIVTVAKTLDAGRLFIRGQFALHKNEIVTNNLYKSLTYLNQADFAQALGTAIGMIRSRKLADEIYNRLFHSSEGWYSAAVFKSGVSVKIIGRGLDDFNKHPVILYKRQLIRCPISDGITLHMCVLKLYDSGSPSHQNSSNMDLFAHSHHGRVEGLDSPVDIRRWMHGYNMSYSDLPDVVPMDVEVTHSKSNCYMNWLPVALRNW